MSKVPDAHLWLSSPEYLIPTKFICLWVAVSFLLSHGSGWAALAREYRTQEPYAGDRWRFQSAQMRWLLNFNHCLTIGANRTGLYLAILSPFRLAHPPLFIPWREISVRPTKLLWLRGVELRLGSELQIPLRIRESLAQKLRASAGTSWPTESLS